MRSLNLIRTEESKQCGKCKEIKGFFAFSKHRQHADGLSTHCKECVNAVKRSSDYRKKANASTKIWRNRPENVGKTKIWSKKFRESDHGKKYYHANYLKRNYDLSVDQYTAMFNEQNGCCAICSRHQVEFSKRLNVDHNHETGKVRELLCSFCNTSLGNFNEDQNLMLKAIQYLNKHKEK